MYASWVIVSAVALFGYAHGRPGANDIPTGDKPNKVLDVLNFRPLSEVDSKTVSETDSKPINEKYPSAILFGRTCGGTIISPTWVITAAHCSLGYSGSVLAGTNTTDNDSGVKRYVKRRVIHPLFMVGPYWVRPEPYNIKQVGAQYDFLLAELTEPLPLDGKTMAAAKLDDMPTLPVGLNVSFAGYGTDHFGGYMRHEMHAMDLAIQSEDVCRTLEQYNSESMLCAKGRPPRYDTACNGDSGSGLVDETGKLLGVTSWVENDALECFNRALLVFARVSSVRNWIREVTNV